MKPRGFVLVDEDGNAIGSGRPVRDVPVLVVDADGNAVPDRRRRGGAPRDKAKAKAARRARKRGRR